MAKILIVEDDINLREIYATRLTDEGYEVESASDGEEALTKAMQVKPQLILLDIMMPKIPGFDVLDILRSTPETKAIKVVVLTALGQQADRERSEKLGADKFLVKSQITLEDVVETVRGMIGTANTTSNQPIAKPKAAASVVEENNSANPIPIKSNPTDNQSPPKSNTGREANQIDEAMQTIIDKRNNKPPTLKE